MTALGEHNSSTTRQTQDGKSPSPNDRTCSKMQMSFPLKDTNGNRVDLQVKIQVSLLSQGLLGSCPMSSSNCRTPKYVSSSLAHLPGPSMLVTRCCPHDQHLNSSPGIKCLCRPGDEDSIVSLLGSLSGLLVPGT